jgi:chlorite dismutase
VIPIRFFEEGIWELSQQNRWLHEHRADIRHAWDDSAARQVNGRHLDPLAEDADLLLAAIRAQHELLSTAEEQLGQADTHGLEAARAGTAARESLRLAEGELRDSQRWQSRSAALLVALHHGLLPQIRLALKNANECGA